MAPGVRGTVVDGGTSPRVRREDESPEDRGHHVQRAEGFEGASEPGNAKDIVEERAKEESLAPDYNEHYPDVEDRAVAPDSRGNRVGLISCVTVAVGASSPTCTVGFGAG